MTVIEDPSLAEAKRVAEINKLYRQLRYWADKLATRNLSDKRCKEERERIIKRLDELERVNG